MTGRPAPLSECKGTNRPAPSTAPAETEPVSCLQKTCSSVGVCSLHQYCDAIRFRDFLPVHFHARQLILCAAFVHVGAVFHRIHHGHTVLNTELRSKSFLFAF